MLNVDVSLIFKDDNASESSSDAGLGSDQESEAATAIGKTPDFKLWKDG